MPQFFKATRYPGKYLGPIGRPVSILEEAIVVLSRSRSRRGRGGELCNLSRGDMVFVNPRI